MKKLVLIPVLIGLLAMTGCLFKSLNSESDYSDDIPKKVDAIPAGIMDVEKEGVHPDAYIYAEVIRVVDGDTVEVKYKKSKYKVRLLDIDTPESVKQGVAVQYFSKEATEFTQKLILNKTVKLVFEEDLRDKHGRLLAHIILNNKDYINGLLVRNGFAREEIVLPNDTYKDYFYQLQASAIREKVGLWGLPGNKCPFVLSRTGKYVPLYWTDSSAP